MSEVNIVIAERIGGVLEVVYCGSASGAAAAIVMRQLYSCGLYRAALWCRACGDDFIPLWSWYAKEKK